MTDTAQPTAGLVRRLVNDPNSTIGTMIKRGSLRGKLPHSGNDGKTAQLIKNIQDLTADDFEPTKTKPKQTDALDVLEQTLNEVAAAPTQTVPAPSPTPMPLNPIAEGVMTQAMPQAINQAVTAADQQQSGLAARKKEATESVGLDQIAVDAARGAQLVEAEPQPEIPPEVESYLQKVEDRQETAPQEIVIADGSQTTPTDHAYPAQPVVVLPITAEEEKQGAKKSPKFSIRWLVEWSRKLMKVFMGKIIYRPAEEAKN